MGGGYGEEAMAELCAAAFAAVQSPCSYRSDPPVLAARDAAGVLERPGWNDGATAARDAAGSPPDPSFDLLMHRPPRPVLTPPAFYRQAYAMPVPNVQPGTKVVIVVPQGVTPGMQVGAWVGAWVLAAKGGCWQVSDRSKSSLSLQIMVDPDGPEGPLPPVAVTVPAGAVPGQQVQARSLATPRWFFPHELCSHTQMGNVFVLNAVRPRRSRSWCRPQRRWSPSRRRSQPCRPQRRWSPSRRRSQPSPSPNQLSPSHSRPSPSPKP